MNPQYLQMLNLLFGNMGGNMWNQPAQNTVVPNNNNQVNSNVMNNTGINSYVAFDPSWISNQNQGQQHQVASFTPDPNNPGNYGLSQMEAEMRNTPGNRNYTGGYNPFTSMNPNQSAQGANITPAIQNQLNASVDAANTNTGGNNNNTNTNILTGQPNFENRKPAFASDNNFKFYSKFA